MKSAKDLLGLAHEARAVASQWLGRGVEARYWIGELADALVIVVNEREELLVQLAAERAGEDGQR